MKQVRISRKEQKLLQARHRQIYAQFLKTSGRKTDPDTLIDGMLASGGDIVGLVRDMQAEVYSDAIAEAEYDRLLFSPSTTDIRKLPPAILDTKEALVPMDLIPSTKGDLRCFLERLMVATGQEENLDDLVAGWSTGQSADHDFKAHVEQLWLLRREEPALYAALVGGRFGSVVRHVQQLPPMASKTRRLRDLLVAQALIWCAHDVQLVIARLTKVPDYGYLLPPSRSLEGALNHMRGRRTALDMVLDLFFGSSAWRLRETQPVWSETHMPLTKHSDEIVRRVAKQIARRRGKLDAGLSPTDVTTMMQQIAAKLRSDGLLARSATPRNINAGAKAYSTDWFGLPPLAAACVAIRRLIQAEQQLPAMIDAVIAGTVAPATSILQPLPAYDDKKLNYKSTGRLDKLLAFYRDEVLADHNENNWRPWKATGAARDFLVARGARKLDDHRGPPGNPCRAFYLLDIIPEHRFAIG